MKFLLFDATPNGKPVSYQASPRDTDNWPRLLHLSWMLMDESGKSHAQRSDVIQPQGFNLNQKALELGHLTETQISSDGIPLGHALEAFMDAVGVADMVFAHNLALHEGILSAEADRTNTTDRLSSADRYCLMQEATYYCAIPGRGGKYKWPSLAELHKRIFKKSFQQAGNADADVKALSRCFIVLYKLGVLEDIFDS